MLMYKTQQKLKRKKEQSSPKETKVTRELILGSVIATLISLTPYLFSLYESVPEQRVWSTFLFTYDSSVWEDANFAMWVFTGKFIPLFLLLIFINLILSSSKNIFLSLLSILLSSIIISFNLSFG